MESDFELGSGSYGSIEMKMEAKSWSIEANHSRREYNKPPTNPFIAPHELNRAFHRNKLINDVKNMASLIAMSAVCVGFVYYLANI